MDVKTIKEDIIRAGHKAIEELIKVAEEPILSSGNSEGEVSSDLSADKLKNAAATKKLAIFDAFEILNRINEEERLLEENEKTGEMTEFKGFAEGRSKGLK